MKNLVITPGRVLFAYIVSMVALCLFGIFTRGYESMVGSIASWATAIGVISLVIYAVYKVRLADKPSWMLHDMDAYDQAVDFLSDLEGETFNVTVRRCWVDPHNTPGGALFHEIFPNRREYVASLLADDVAIKGPLVDDKTAAQGPEGCVEDILSIRMMRDRVLAKKHLPTGTGTAIAEWVEMIITDANLPDCLPDGNSPCGVSRKPMTKEHLVLFARYQRQADLIISGRRAFIAATPGADALTPVD